MIDNCKQLNFKKATTKKSIEIKVRPMLIFKMNNYKINLLHLFLYQLYRL